MEQQGGSEERKQTNIRRLSRSGDVDLDAPGYAIKVLVGNSNRKLGGEIATALGVPLASCEVASFSDGETKIHIEHNIRGTDCYVIQPTCHNFENGTSVNDNLMELYALSLFFFRCAHQFQQFDKKTKVVAAAHPQAVFRSQSDSSW